MAASDHACLTEGCGKTATLQCPTCIKLKIEGSYFCSQDCFKKNWVSKKRELFTIILMVANTFYIGPTQDGS
jgi:hypothetical protein